MIDKICSYMRYEVILNVHIYSNIFFSLTDTHIYSV